MQRFVMAVIVLVSACGGRGIQSGPAPTAATVDVWRVDLEDNSNATLLQARNNGTDPVIINELRLYACTNLRQDCTTHQPNVRIEPGQTALVARLEPSNHNQRPRFGYEFKWRGVARAPVSAAPPADRLVQLGELIPLVAANTSNQRCGNPATTRPGVHLMTMHFGSVTRGDSRAVTLQLDDAGGVLRYSESRGDLRVAPNPSVPAPRVDNPGHRSDFTVDLANGAVVLTNLPANGAPQRLVARGGMEMLEAPNLGIPSTTIALMRRQCR